MAYVFMLITGLVCGGVAAWAIVRTRWYAANSLRIATDAQIEQLKSDRAALYAKESEFVVQVRKQEVERAEQLKRDSDARSIQENQLNSQRVALAREKQEFTSRVVSYQNLADENDLLKRELQNIDVNIRKLQLDTNLGRERQVELDSRADALAKRFIKDNVKWISSNLTPNNYSTMKDRLTKVMDWCRGIGFVITVEQEQLMVDDLKTEFELVVKRALEREEQQRIKAQLREDLKIERERERERQQAERERQQLEREQNAIAEALETALKESSNQHSDEIQRLQSMLKEAEEKAREAAEKSARAMSQAQLTKAGHVYVVSNLGSFGGDVFKIGMTRRLEPLDRVTELGDASVPFPFDVHMMISCNDAPALEYALHKELNKVRINRTNPRKEFFRTDIETIRKIVVENHGEVDYVADQDALEYWASKEMREEDAQFIDQVYEAVDGGRDAVIED